MAPCMLTIGVEVQDVRGLQLAVSYFSALNRKGAVSASVFGLRSSRGLGQDHVILEVSF